MKPTDIIRHFLGQLDLWIYDNIGTGDGTNHIKEIWQAEPDMCVHLCDKWNAYKAKAAEETGCRDLNDRNIQKLAFMQFLGNLDETNMDTFIQYIAENSRPKA